jgi:polynucleotide 5'-kinase involved in rRNA processing
LEKRKNLRERSYAKYLRDAKVKAFPLYQLETALPAGHDEVGLLLGLFDARRKFLGIGVLREVDFTRKTLKVFTSVSAKPASVVLGKVRLDENLRETAP